MLHTKSQERERVFALILTRHRRWGIILMPHMLEKMPRYDYYTVVEALSPFPHSTTLTELNNEEKEVVRLINEYSERRLNKLFSKQPNVKLFLEEVTQQTVTELIRPYIERRVVQCLQTALNEEIPLYLQKAGINSFHQEDLLKIEPDKANPLFRFERTSVETSYQLIIETGPTTAPLHLSAAEIITSTPCIIRCNRSIFFIEGIDGAKVRPFLAREKIVIPETTAEKYFSSFVLQMINSHRVTGTGFTIEHRVPEKKAKLIVEESIMGFPAALLQFIYDGRKIYYPDKQTHFTQFRNESGDFKFYRKERDRVWEKECLRILEESGLFSEEGVYFTTPGQDDDDENLLYELIEVISGSRKRLEAAGIAVEAGNLKKRYSFEPMEVTLSHQEVNDWFDLRAEVHVGTFIIPFIRLSRHILDGIREYQLPDGTIALLPHEWFTRYKELFVMGRQSGDSLLLQKHHFAILNELITGGECESCFTLGNLAVPERLTTVPVPEEVKTELRAYQQEGLNWLLFLQNNNLGGCLADDMGLGKTVQTLSLLMWNRQQILTAWRGNGAEARKAGQRDETQPTLFGGEEAPVTSLIIVPASLCHNWHNEIKRFCPSLKTLIHHGAGRQKKAARFTRYDIVISSYHTVRQDIELLSAINFFYVILDESQYIKNPTSHTYRTVMRLRSAHRLVLTGTPIENSLTDLWTQLNFVNPGLLGSFSYFRKEFAMPIEKNGRQEKEERLKKIIHPFILRRTKEIVFDQLPPLTEQTIYCDMQKEQAALYEKEKSAIRNLILENIETVGLEKSAIIVLQGLMKLRQLANHPLMTDENYTGGSGKFDAVTHNIESVVAEGHKILLFSSFVKHLDLYPDWLNKSGIGYAMLTGSTRDREKVIASFMNDPDIKVFLISLKAGGTGLNLTKADYVFIVDPWWNPAAEIQALSRAHRSGQEKNVFVHRYISGNTLEEKIQKLQKKKSRLADTLIAANNPLADLDVQEMFEIID